MSSVNSNPATGHDDRPQADAGPDAEVLPFPTPRRSVGVAVPRPATEHAGADAAGDATSDAETDAMTGAGEDASVAELPVPVDGAEAQREARAWDRAEWRPILPGWVKSAADAKSAVGWLARFVGHEVAYHGLRVPKYLGKLLWWSPRGAGRAVAGWVRWLLDLEGRPVRLAVVRAEDAKAYRELMRDRDRHVRWRGIVTTIAAVAIVAVVVAGLWALPALGIWQAPAWGLWLAGAAGVAGFGLAGRPADRPLLDTAVVVPRAAKLTSATVRDALSVALPAIGSALGKNPRALGFAAPITRDGPGWRADVDLPAGITAGEVIDRRDKLAAALSRPLGCVWPETQPDIHPGRLVLWCADEDMATARQPPWPLAKTGRVDLFEAFPFGTDQRGRVVLLDLDSTNMLFGAIPGYGKTRALLVPLLAAALDPNAEIWDYDLKGVGDHKPIGKVATRYVAGGTDEHVEATLQGLRDAMAELQRRQQTMDGLSERECPTGKVTPELAGRKDLGLHHLVIGIDECQELFTHPEFGKEAGDLAERIIRLGRALNVKLLLATQRPDAKSLPTGITANVGTRYCLRVMDQTANDMILGTSANKNGLRATMFTRRDKGVGWLVGGNEPQICRAYFIDGPVATLIAERARTARERADTLSGYAVDQANPEQPSDRFADLLHDLTAVVHPGNTPTGKVWVERVQDRLTAHRPQTYADVGRDELVAALRRHGIRTKGVWGTTDDGTGANRRGIDRDDGTGANRRGIDRDDLTKAITERDTKRSSRDTG